MAGWILPLSIVGAALALSVELALARRIASQLGADEPSLARGVAWLALLLLGSAGTAFVHGEWLTLAVGAVVALVAFVGAAEQLRGNDVQRRLATSGLYLAALVSFYGDGHARGWLTGTRASRSFTYLLHETVTGAVWPLVDGFTRVPRAGWATPAATIAALADSLASHVLVAGALGALVVASFAAAYLSEQPLPAPGTDLLPVPRATSLLLAAVALCARLAPAESIAAVSARWIVIALVPFYFAEALALLHRWLAVLHVRLLLLALLVLAALAWPALFVALAVFGWLAELGGLREIVPFVALVERPILRPRLVTSVLGATALAACIALGTWSRDRLMARASPRLGLPSKWCAAVTSQVDWSARRVVFTGPELHFSIAVDEAASVSGSDAETLTAACTARGGRLCTSDEWYVACLCTYPVDASESPSFLVNQDAVAHAARERDAPAPAASVTTLSNDKRSEVRGLITGRAELVSLPGGPPALAGASDALADPLAADCRHRALLTPAALATRAGDYTGSRCCW